MRNLILLLGATLAWGQQASPADPVVVTVGNEKITKSQFEQILTTLPEQQQAMIKTPQGRRQVADQLAELMAMAQEAHTEKLDQNSLVKTELMLHADQVLATALFEHMSDALKPDDAALHAYYDEHKQDWESVQGRHILIRMQGSRVPLRTGEKDLSDAEALAKAKEIRAKIVAGGDFATIAKAESDDAGSGANGGDLGSFTRGRMVPEFEEAAFALKVGDISQPVKTQFGYHLIQVQSHESKPFDAVKPEITEKIKPELAKMEVDNIKKKTTITLDEAYFGK